MKTIYTVLTTLLICSCGSSGSDTSTSSTEADSQIVQEWYDNGTLASSGSLDELDRKDGLWQWYYDDGQLMTEASFTAGAFNEQAAWIIYNQDGSVRADSSDGTYIFDKPWEE